MNQDTNSNPAPTIEKAIEEENWKSAQTLIRTALKRKPQDHWLLARLALTYYEQHDYNRALKHGLRAARIAPYCPLVLWEVAGGLGMLDEPRAALALYRKLTNESLSDLAHGPCGEGLPWARGLLSDAYYRIGRIHE